MSITVQDAVKGMLQIVAQLQDTYPKKKFTLDGRLVGDLGKFSSKANTTLSFSIGSKNVTMEKPPAVASYK